MLRKVKKLVFDSQESIISAAFVIMAMSVAVKVVGVLRYRVLLEFFTDREMALFFAAFRMPDLVFEVLTFGALSSAFIPVFSRLYSRDKQNALKTAAIIVNVGLLIFTPLFVLFLLFAEPIYRLIAPGFAPDQTRQIADMAKMLFFAQGFFLVSYVLTGVLEGLRRFVLPAIAPLFYYTGIILGTLVFSPTLGLKAPVIGAIIGAVLHLLIQLPVAVRLGFRFTKDLGITSEVKKIGKLAAPRVFELSVLQISRVVELALASLISTAAYAHYNFAYTVQAFPIGFFALSLAKAALPTLSMQADDLKKFRKTLLRTLYQIMFLVIPMAAIMIVLRIPIVRLLFGTDNFDWNATVQTGLVLSSFAIGIPFQAAVVLLTRAFFALHNTKTPVKVSLLGTCISILSGIILVIGFSFPTWALGLAYALGVIIQAIVLFYLLSKTLNHGTFFAIGPIIKSAFSASVAGAVMYILIKFFDRWTWIQRLSLVGHWEVVRRINFETFVIDTSYTINLIFLTAVTAIIGVLVYIMFGFILKSEELFSFINILRKKSFTLTKEEEEPLSPAPTDTTQV